MTRDAFLLSLRQFAAYEFVKSYAPGGPTSCVFEIVIDQESGATQCVEVYLEVESEEVVALALIGRCPEGSEALARLLEDNCDGCYSRIALLGDDLIQIYKYLLREAEPQEMAQSIYETARRAFRYQWICSGSDLI